MVPGVQFIFPVSLMPHAPDDMIAALGKNGQYVDVVPSLGMVVIRMGNAPGEGEVSLTLNDLIWEHISGLDGSITSTEENRYGISNLTIYPNPTTDIFTIHLPYQHFDLYLYDVNGNVHLQRKGCYGQEEIKSELISGVYFVKVVAENTSYTRRVIVH